MQNISIQNTMQNARPLLLAGMIAALLAGLAAPAHAALYMAAAAQPMQAAQKARAETPADEAPKPGEPRYVIGKPLPEDIAYAPVPPRLTPWLGKPPRGYVFGLVDEDILLISLKNRRVVEAMTVDGETRK